MISLEWSTISYEQPLPRPIVTAHGSYEAREGFLVCARATDGVYGIGDVAPLPGFSRETLGIACAQWPSLSEQVSRLESLETVADLSAVSGELARKVDWCPSLLFGVETALADLGARRANVALAQWLNPEAVQSVAVNALLHGGDTASLCRSATEKSEQGYRTFKLKAGTAAVSEDAERIRAVCGAVPGANIRVDANAAWDSSQFRDLCRRVSGLKLEFVELPLPAGMAEDARTIAEESGLALALDEDVDSVEAGRELISRRLCDVIVLKPMALGGLMGCLRLAQEASHSGIGVVFTSAWESDVGVAATMHLAAACRCGERASGLSTAGAIAGGLVAPALRIENGRLGIWERPGLGLTLV